MEMKPVNLTKAYFILKEIKCFCTNRFWAYNNHLLLHRLYLKHIFHYLCRVL